MGKRAVCSCPILLQIAQIQGWVGGTAFAPELLLIINKERTVGILLGLLLRRNKGELMKILHLLSLKLVLVRVMHFRNRCICLDRMILEVRKCESFVRGGQLWLPPSVIVLFYIVRSCLSVNCFHYIQA